MNVVIEHGRLCKDVELKMAKGTGMAIAKFTIAVKAMKKDAPSNFFNCTAFGKTAELISETLSKGSPIFINGYLQSGSYTNKMDIKVYTTDIIVNLFDYEDKQKNAEPKSDVTFIDDDSPF